jgi:hypothetical protein
MCVPPPVSSHQCSPPVKVVRFVTVLALYTAHGLIAALCLMDFRAARWVLRLRGGRSAGARLCGAGTRDRCHAQLPG